MVRDGIEGFIVPPRDVDAPGRGDGTAGRSTPSSGAGWPRLPAARAEEFDWPRYHGSILEAVDELTSPSRTRAQAARALAHQDPGRDPA